MNGQFGLNDQRHLFNILKKFATLEKISYKSDLLGHGPSLHDSSLTLSPTHLAPPYFGIGLSQNLCAFLTP